MEFVCCFFSWSDWDSGWLGERAQRESVIFMPWYHGYILSTCFIIVDVGLPQLAGVASLSLLHCKFTLLYPPFNIVLFGRWSLCSFFKWMKKDLNSSNSYWVLSKESSFWTQTQPPLHTASLSATGGHFPHSPGFHVPNMKHRKSWVIDMESQSKLRRG